MSINISGNTIAGGNFDTSGYIKNTPYVSSGDYPADEGFGRVYLDAGDVFSYPGSPAAGGYYTCGYGCQYYASDPGCTNCNARWMDVSGFGNDATLSSTAMGGYSDIGGYMNFNGSSYYATLPINTSLRPYQEMTMEAWINFTSTAGSQVFIAMQYGSAGDNSFALWWDGSAGTLNGGVRIASATYITYSWSPSTDTWYHIAYVYDGQGAGQEYLYINGAQVQSGARSGTVTWGGNTLITIGMNYDGAGIDTGPAAYFNGKMAVVRMYRYPPLTAANILSNYNADRSRFGL